jgi:hypothetical protein
MDIVKESIFRYHVHITASQIQEGMEVTIDFSCPNCETALRAPDEHAGKIAKCKKCNAKVLIPRTEEVELVADSDLINQPKYSHSTISLRAKLKKLQFPELKRFRLTDLPDEDVKAILDWGLWTYRLGSSERGTIDEIKYDGRLIILNDGNRFEVANGDTFTAERWFAGDEVVVMSNRMYRLDESESISVSKE